MLKKFWIFRRTLINTANLNKKYKIKIKFLKKLNIYIICNLSNNKYRPCHIKFFEIKI